MSVINFNFFSGCLKSNNDITVIMPDRPWPVSPSDFYTSGKKYKVLWLLHGTFGDHSDWLRKSNIELYATEKDLVVVMPSALNSNYSNWDDYMMGFRMYDFLTEELMPLVYGWLPVSDKREDNYIAGLSMGGRGAIKYAVNHPERFAAAAILSAVPVDFAKISPGNPDMMLNSSDDRLKRSIENAGGLDAFQNSSENVWAIIDGLAAGGTLPRLMLACGEEDEMLYANYRAYQKHCGEIGLDVHWYSLPGYAHEWRFWDLAIQEALVFFGLGEKGGNPF